MRLKSILNLNIYSSNTKKKVGKVKYNVSILFHPRSDDAHLLCKVSWVPSASCCFTELQASLPDLVI